MAKPVSSPPPANFTALVKGSRLTATTIPVVAVSRTSQFGIRRLRRSETHAAPRNATNAALLMIVAVSRGTTTNSPHRGSGEGRVHLREAVADLLADALDGDDAKHRDEQDEHAVLNERGAL